ncbi:MULTISPECIES: hypothetical protein [Sphingobacterium]|uniref:hypothetical protein n=1 Tax=Sphingobacterium TaxID=28453 RepID=UPI00257F239D|nr:MULTISPECIES: hypothetical protein [Sphingobacterium]
MNQKFYSAVDLKKAASLVQKYLKENKFNYINIEEAQILLDKENIDIDLKYYFSSLPYNVVSDTLIYGAHKYYLNRWRIFLDNRNNTILNERERLMCFLYIRLKKGKNSFKFSAFFFIIIFTIGLLGSFLGNLEIMLTVLKNLTGENLCRKLTYLFNHFDSHELAKICIGYSIVLICSSSGDYLFPKLDNGEKHFSDIKSLIRMTGFLVILISIILSLICYFIPYSVVKLILSLFLVILSMLVWFVGNARYGTFITEPKFNAENGIVQLTGGSANVINGQIPPEFKF